MIRFLDVSRFSGKFTCVQSFQARVRFCGNTHSSVCSVERSSSVADRFPLPFAGQGRNWVRTCKSVDMVFCAYLFVLRLTKNDVYSLKMCAFNFRGIGSTEKKKNDSITCETMSRYSIYSLQDAESREEKVHLFGKLWGIEMLVAGAGLSHAFNLGLLSCARRGLNWRAYSCAWFESMRLIIVSFSRIFFSLCFFFLSDVNPQNLKCLRSL